MLKLTAVDHLTNDQWVVSRENETTSPQDWPGERVMIDDKLHIITGVLIKPDTDQDEKTQFVISVKEDTDA